MHLHRRLYLLSFKKAVKKSICMILVALIPFGVSSDICNVRNVVKVVALYICFNSYRTFVTSIC